MKKYDYLVVGAGLFGATLADILTRVFHKSVLVVEKNQYIGGMCYTENKHGITVHTFGAHIFRTNESDIWNYVNSITSFKPFVNSPLARVGDKLYNLPFNMNTFQQLWGVTTPEEAHKKIKEDCVVNGKPKNLEDYALATVGKTIFETFIRDYTEKQWGAKCTELPIGILGRLPLRFTYDNNYYANKMYQGVPIAGYTEMISKMLSRSELKIGCNDWRIYIDSADKVIYTGSIDEFYEYKYGELEYRSLRFEHHVAEIQNIQGNAVINYPTREVEYTRSIEHKHFLNESSSASVISYEYPALYDGTNERYYPIENERNLRLYNKYASIKTDTIFAGRLGQYKYTDMEQTIVNAQKLAYELEGRRRK